MNARRIVVIGLGNLDRGDDGVGPVVAAALRDMLPPQVRLLHRRGDMLSLLDDWAGADGLVCIDAAASMGQPGRIHRIDLTRDVLPPTPSAASSHALGLADAVALARALGTVPRRVIVFAVEGDDFTPGAPLTGAVAGAVGEVALQVAAEVERLWTVELETTDA